MCNIARPSKKRLQENICGQMAPKCLKYHRMTIPYTFMPFGGIRSAVFTCYNMEIAPPNMLIYDVHDMRFG